MIKTNKLVAAIVGMTLVLSLVGAVSASAMTAQEMLQLLIAAGVIAPDKAAAATAAMNAVSAPATSGYSFAKDLTVGSRGADVTALQNTLGISPATGYFGALTKAAVIKFQLAKGISPAAGYVGAKTRAVLNASVATVPTTPGTGTTVPAGTSLTVAMAPTSPASGAVVKGQSIADLAEFTFTNTSATPAVVTNVTLQRSGVSNDSAMSNVYLYNGINRLTDSATVSSGKISFNAPTGLFTIPAGSSMVVSVRSDISSSATIGQILVVSLTGVTANVPVSASYPISGASQTISTASVATVTLSGSSTPTTTTIDPQADFVMWQQTVSIGTNDVYMRSISLRQIGSVAAGDLSNFRFYVDGTQVGPTLAAYDSNGYLTLDLSANPVKLMTGSHVMKLVGDIIGGSTRNFSFSLRQVSDLNVIDSQLNINVAAVTGAGASFSNNDTTTGTVSVSSGSISIIKKTDSPSGNVTLLASGQTLGRFEVKAAGEPMKVETLNVKFAGSNVGPIRNGALFANDIQIGSSADIASSSVGTQYNLGSSLVVYPGSPVIVEVRGDIYTSSGTQVVNGNVITVSLVAGSSNVQRLKSLSYIGTSAVSANQLTVSQGTLSLSKYGAYANQSVVAPQTAIKLGEYSLTAGTTEDLNLNTITVAFTASTTNVSDLTDLYVVYGPKVSNIKSTVSTTSDNAFSVNYTLKAGQSIDIAVYGTLASSIGASDYITSKLSIAGQTALSTQTVTVPTSSYTSGQTISITTGNLNLATYNVQASTTVVASTMVKAGSFQFVATGDSFTIDQLIATIPTASAGNVANVIWKVGSTVLNGAGTSVDTSGTGAVATSTGLNIAVPANNSNGVIVDAYLNLANIGTPGNASSSKNVQITLVGYRKMTSTGIQTDVGGLTSVGNAQYVFKSVPTITNVDLPETGTASLSAGTKTIARVRISADANGAIDWSKISFAVTKATAVSLGATASDWKLTDDSGSQIVGTISTSTDLATTTGGVTSGVVSFVPTSPETISAGASKVYRLKTVVGGTIAANDAVTTKITQSTAGMIQSTASSTAAASSATFVWSDRSFVPHSATTPDWNNDTLIKNLPTDSQTIIN